MCPSLYDPNLLDGVTARIARFSFSIIHGKCGLCLTLGPIRFAIPANACAFAPQAIIESTANRGMQRANLLRSEGVGGTQGVNLRAMQGLIRVDIAHAC